MLTDKQEMFCKEYIKHLNAAKAARDAGYSEKTCDRIGHENLGKLEIKKRIQDLMSERSQRLKIDADNVLNDILDTRDTLAQNMLKNDSGEVDSSVANARLKANELLGKHLKLFTDKVEHSGKVEHSVQIVDDI